MSIRRAGDQLQIIFIGEGFVPGWGVASATGRLRRFSDNIAGVGIGGMLIAGSVADLATDLL